MKKIKCFGYMCKNEVWVPESFTGCIWCADCQSGQGIVYSANTEDFKRN